MGTHPIFESDFDCLTEWNHFGKMDEISAEIYDFIRTIRDPERPESLEDLDVVKEEYVHVKEIDEDYYDVVIYYKPTVEHCHLATLIGLFIREKIRREIPPEYFRYKLKILAIPGSLQNEEDANRQVNDKERVAAALEKDSMMRLVDQCINNEEG